MTAPAFPKVLSVAPMMDWTDRHDRYFLRLFNPHVRLYTEMVTTGALLHGDAPRFLKYDAIEHPLALQLGGSDPAALAACAKMAEDWGYDEVNLNVGCPSDRVQQGKIGACLMAEPALVAECIAAMQQAVRIPVTVKHRIGIDGLEDYDHMRDFVATVAATGCQTFVVHARIAILAGLSPKENREIPPLRYDDVYRLKAEFPQLEIHLNGGVKSVAEIQQHWERVDGVMVGREAYHNPWLLAQARPLFGLEDIPSRDDILEQYLDFMAREMAEGVPLSQMTRHILGLFQGLPGARRWRQHISENAHRKGAGLEVVRQAARHVQDALSEATTPEAPAA
ncbi:MAG TPA: tRNA dihydrouridine(20/20a) synthase DusA [Moraxellaceae bacterium]|nr:tRNA dihydrouridine(20/20a) synthase DusA [Moraxellaceae bacterium]